MKSNVLRFLVMVTVMIICFSFQAYGLDTSFVQVIIHPPTGELKMGNNVKFTGIVKNLGQRKLERLVVYLSFVSLEPGNEHPMDLEDWSAQKAVRIDSLLPGQPDKQSWGMRLIQAGKYGLVLTVINPTQKKPTISDLMPFTVNPKKNLSLKRILPVAVIEPTVLIVFWGLLTFFKQKGVKKDEKE